MWRKFHSGAKNCNFISKLFFYAARVLFRKANNPSNADKSRTAPAGSGTASGELGSELVLNIGKAVPTNGDVKSGGLNDTFSPDA